jgi:hypothetical protein
MRAVILALALTAASVSAFHAPAVNARRSVAKMALPDYAVPADAVGATTEVGGKVFDPLKLSKWRPFDEMRAAELRNGRVAMLGSVGWIWPQMVGPWGTDHVTTVDPIKAIVQVEPQAWAQIFLLAGTFEVLDYKHDWSKGPLWDPLALMPKEPAAAKARQEQEIKHGRLAMLSWASFVAAHYIPGSVPLLPLQGGVFL